MNEFEKRADKVGDWAARVLICVGFFSLLLVVAIAVGRTVMSDVLAWFAANTIGPVLLLVSFMAIVGVVVGIVMGRRWLS